MTGPEHYAKAEKHLADAAGIETDGDQDSTSAWHQRQAQVHATLALAAQRADMPTVVVNYDGKIASSEQARALARWMKTAMRTAGGAS
jgi:hypothetical protein